MRLVLTVLFVMAACNVYQAFALPLHNFAAADKTQKRLDQAQNEKSEVKRFYGHGGGGYRKVIAMILDEMKQIKKQRLIQEESLRDMNSAKAEGYGYGYGMNSAKAEGYRGYGGYRPIQEERDMNSAKAEGYGYDGYRTVQKERDMNSAKAERYGRGYGAG